EKSTLGNQSTYTPPMIHMSGFFFFQAEDGIRDGHVTGVQTCALPISSKEDEEIANKLYAYHQGYGLTGVPAPLLIQNGWTDDLFPPKEALRIYNAALALKGKVTLQLGDLGHSRGSNKENTDHAFQEQGASFFAAGLEHVGTAPASGAVTAYTQTCPMGAPGGGPFTATSWPKLHEHAVTFGSEQAQILTSAGGNPTIASEFDPIAGTSDACK